MTNQAISITAPMESGEVAVFKLIPMTEINEFFDNVEMIVSPDCIQDGVEMGFWKVA